MPSIVFWIGVVIFGLGAIFGLLSAMRTLQTSRRWSDYRLRQRYVVQARGSMLFALISGGLALALLILARSSGPASAPAAVPTTVTSTALPTASPVSAESPTATASPTVPAPTETPVTPSPVVIPTTPAASATPAMPIAVQAMVQGTATPAFEVEFGRLRFSTEINNYTLVAPGEKFINPIKQVYSVFTYQPLGVKVEWIALWYQNGALKYVDTTSWKDFPAGVAVAGWTRPATEWEPGEYEVQIFLGTDWKASGRFTLEGNPPSPTPSPFPSATATIAATFTASSTSTVTRTPTASPLPPPSRTPSSTPTATLPPTATRTSTPQPSATSRPAPSATSLPSATALPSSTATNTATRAPSSTPAPTLTSTPRPSATPIPSSTATRTPTLVPSLTPTPTQTATLMPVSMDIYFTKGSGGTSTSSTVEAVRRQIAGTNDVLAAALDQYFAGPTVDEQKSGLLLTRNGFAGYRRVEFANGVVSVYLSGNCVPSGTGASLAQPLISTLKQFPGVLYVKLYDAYDHTGNALSAADSWPTCLDVIFTTTSTASPTARPTLTPSTTPTSSPIPTNTPRPTATATQLPTSTPLPTDTPRPLPTRTPNPTATATQTPRPTSTWTSTPSRTPTVPPTATLTVTPRPSSTPAPTLTPTVTFTPGPTWTPRPTLTLTPINAPTRALSSASQAASPAGPTPTLDAACDHAEFLGDVTIVDNATLRPGESFRKTWRIQNAGNCSWTAAYHLVFVRGDQMGGPDSVALPALVAPGQSADISVDLLAPGAAGDYGGFWQLRTPGGATFGMGPAGSGDLWVQIRVAGPPMASPTATRTAVGAAGDTPTGWAEATLTAFVATQTAEAAPTATLEAAANAVVVADLAGSACQAQWQANGGVLGCPGTDGDPKGAVIVLSQAPLEDGPTLSAPTLLTIPSDAADGYVLGLYPQYQVRPGDRFQAGVGCEIGASLCSVLFRVSYLDTMGAAHDLWTVGEFLDGHHVDLDLDLRDLAGQQIRIVLSVGNLGDSTGDRALWVAPRIVNVSGGQQAASPTARPTSTAAATATLAASPTPRAAATSTAIPPTAIPTVKPPIPQFYDAVVEFFRQLFGKR